MAIALLGSGEESVGVEAHVGARDHTARRQARVKLKDQAWDFS